MIEIASLYFLKEIFKSPLAKGGMVSRQQSGWGL